jgi:5-methylcytosine-specific restriction endonuclease McrA
MVIDTDPRKEGHNGSATILDHRVPLKASAIYGNTFLDTDENCAGACEPCHRRKSSLEGHWLSGHNVERPWSDDDLDRARRAAVEATQPKPVRVPRPIIMRL